MSADLIARLRDPRFIGQEAMRLSAADEIERLRALVLDACKVFAHYDLPEHAFHYQRALDRPLEVS